MSENPFIERGRITNPERFIGRWGELSLLFDRMDARQPVLIHGVPGIGKSSLITHVVQSAAINLERPELRAFYLDLRGATSMEQVYATLISALGDRGETNAAFEVALATFDAPVLICFDNAQAILTTDWGDRLLEALARMARSRAIMLVVAHTGSPPLLSERFAMIGLGAFAPTEVRLLTETYLEETGVTFTPRELDQLAILSAGHPAYLQRAAFHLFRAKQDPQVQWRTEYLAEARERPIPGSPLPPAVFTGAGEGNALRSQYDLADGETVPAGPPLLAVPEPPVVLIYVLLICCGLLIAIIGFPFIGIVSTVLLIGMLWFWNHRLR
jgi:hypothetical protein